LVYDDAVTAALVDRCTDIAAGARNIDSVIDRVLLPEIAKSLLLQLSDERRFSQLKLAVKEDGEFAFTFA
jgi:type VI secretion system protein VasG